jgi:hopanoid biosynthesis associated protein HpnK
MKQLIINADDFGYTIGVNRAIVEASQATGGGVITSTSLIVNGRAFDNAVELAGKTPGLDIGCHLNLVEGKPVCTPERVASLVNSGGRFPGASQLAVWLVSGKTKLADLELECSAQVERLLAAGIQPSHLDTHQHAHLHPRVATAVARTARRYQIPWVRRPFENSVDASGKGKFKRRILASGLHLLARMFDRIVKDNKLHTLDHFSGFILTGKLTAGSLRKTLLRLPEGTTELMCHPGYADEALAKARTILQAQRQQELEALRDPQLPALLREQGVHLTSFRDLMANLVAQPETTARGAFAADAKHVATSKAETGRI